MLKDHLKKLFHYLLPKKSLTLLMGLFANSQISFIKNHAIRMFIRRFDVNMQEALKERPEDYPSFNDFFIRALKPGIRVFAHADLISPVDGCISELGAINHGKLIQAKNRDYTIDALLGGDKNPSAAFQNGRFMTLYLSPKDYHRVHMPITGTLCQTRYIPGRLFSVQPFTTKMIPRLFAENERLVAYFQTSIGLMAMVMVGATIVGTIGTIWQGDILRCRHPLSINYTSQPIEIQQGAEMGYFKLGSTVILLFAEGDKMQWGSQLNATLPLQLGQPIGQFI